MLHEFLNLGKERLARDVRIMLAQDFVAQLHHLAAADAESGFFKALQDIAAMAFGDAIGLQKNEGRFHNGNPTLG